MDYSDHIALAAAVMGSTFFQIIQLSGLCNLSRAAKRYRHLQLDRESLTNAIIGSTRAKRDFEGRLALFGIMPRAIIGGHSADAITLLRAARAYERDVIPNRRLTYPAFYQYAYYSGICGSSGKIRERVWKDIAKILCEMLEKGLSIKFMGEDSEPWSTKSFKLRKRKAIYYLNFYDKRRNKPTLSSVNH